MTIVKHKLTLPGLQPQAGAQVRVQLVTPGYDAAAQAEISNVATLRTAADGTYTADLTPNGSLQPANTYYVLTHPDGETVWVSVPASGPVWVNDIRVTTPAALGSLFHGLPSGGTTGQALVKNTGGDFDVAWGTVAGGPGGSVTKAAVIATGVAATDLGGDAAGAATAAQSAAVAPPPTQANDKASAAQAAAISAAATDATTKAAAAQAAAISAAATDATTKVAGEATARASAITAAVNALINSAPGTLDTLGEIAAQLATDESAVGALTALVTAKLAKAANLSDLADPAAARGNLGLGSAATQPSSAFAAAGNYVAVVTHGSTASTARPAGAPQVQWIGTVSPTNAVLNDLWLDTSTSPATPRRYTGSAFESLVPTPLATTTSPIEGNTAIYYGHSYSTGTGATNSFGYIQRMQRRLNLGSTFNRAVSGSSAHSEAFIQPVPDVNSYMHSPGFAVFADSVINNAGAAESATYGGGSTALAQATALAGFTNMKMFLVACTRRTAGGVLDTAGTYSGTWTANTGDAESIVFSTGGAGTSHSTTTQNDSVTYSGLTAGAKVVVLLQGIDNGKAATAGASFSITATGMTTITGTTGNQFYRGFDSMTRSVMPVIVQLPAGVTSLTITKTDATGTVLYSNGLIYVAASGVAPWLILLKAPYVNTIATATVDRFNAALDSAVAAFADNGVVVIDPNANGWNTSTMLAADGLHPNDRGHGFLADLYVKIVTALAYGVTANGIGRNTTIN